MRDLYYEEHNDTAVMFASIITDDLQDSLDEKKFLSLMNEYIIAFDTVRFYIIFQKITIINGINIRSL